MHDSLGWLTISQRSTYVLLNFVRNVLLTRLPKILYERLFSQFAQHNYQTRYVTERRFILPKAKTSMMQKTVMYRAMVRWNSLPLHIVQEDTRDRFKILLKQYLKLFKEA